jgi:ABC-type glycerol-3-phosphate transport system permease component
LHNYFEVFKREPFLRYLLNSAIVASIAAVSSVWSRRWRGSVREVSLPGRDVFFPRHRRHPDGPVPVGRGAALRLDERLGLLDTYAGIVAPDLVSVFGVFLMRQAIETIPNDYIDAAASTAAASCGSSVW